MNDFCKTCSHRKIPNILKDKYNHYIKETFIECPFNDKQIAGCMIKNFNIKWEDFFKWALQKNLITDYEKSILEKEGWKISS